MATTARQIFVNLPVKDLAKSVTFFKALGFAFNSQFTDETAACMVISDDIYAMLLIHDKFRQFTPKAIADAAATSEVLTCISQESRDAVNKLVDDALKAGATKLREPQDYGFMFERSFQDPDGHIWEVMWMDPANVNH